MYTFTTKSSFFLMLLEIRGIFKLNHAFYKQTLSLVKNEV